MGRPRKPRPAETWRISIDHPRTHAPVLALSDEEAPGVVDEVVIGGLLHAENLDNGRSWYVRVADRSLWVYVGRDGKARITHEETRK